MRTVARNYLPRQCGIATSTTDLREAIATPPVKYNLWYNISTFNWMLCVLSAAKPFHGLAAFLFRRKAG
jgi:hypothetical protein